jgi:hypothetical protein
MDEVQLNNNTVNVTTVSAPEMLLACLVYWNVVFSLAALAANLTALVAHLSAWSAFYQRARKTERLGYFVFLTAVFANLTFIVLVRVPVVHADLNGSGFLFGDAVCKVTQVLDVSLSLFQFVVSCCYLAAVWRRTKRTVNTYDLGHNDCPVKDGVIVILFTVMVSLTVGLVLSFKFDNVDILVPATISREEAMRTLRSGADFEEGSYCTSSWRGSLWLSCFRWSVGFLGPLLLLALPAGVQLARLRNRFNSSLRNCSHNIKLFPDILLENNILRSASYLPHSLYVMTLAADLICSWLR